ncbi:dolichyl-diphosphooligosaccharide-protein glycotransferase [Starmerella bacillaris]|uniref:Dolichyl-diphosphooligosaccharide--protein glycosyltransferase subunit WBP1 n=1 Tax=Starmerella bacillaris TaxID=1247836 RepID=A0AAV5RGB6_STABA|nr:dolichyl-diphosphooligosaccharide-protein glycotransferase [Starmerella bacillaris]
MVSRLLTILLALCASVLAIPPPESQRVLIVHDEANSDLDVQSLGADLVSRGYNVDVAQFTQHPQLLHFGERVYDNVLILSGKLKAFGKTLRAADFLQHMKLGGNLLMLSTPKHNPSTVREVADQLGFTVAPKGVEYANDFNNDLVAHQAYIIPEASGDLNGASVAKLGDNELLLPLISGAPTSYSFNRMKQAANTTVSDVFALGEDNTLAVGLQTLSNSRFAWIGSPELLKGEIGNKLTSWVFKEMNNLRLVKATHVNELGESDVFYQVNEPVVYCAQVEEWDPKDGKWYAYLYRDEIQLELRMLDPYYRLNLKRTGCIAFNMPDQYGMFTFHLDYKTPGFSFLKDDQIVTVLQRSNDAWDRSWTITNSWVYLGGVTTSVMGFMAFVVLYLAAPSVGTDGTESTDGKVEKASSQTKKAESSSASTGTKSEPKKKKS